ncbi:MAG: hypothetical protein K2X50_00735 [Gammaproteobacteria bacterium]|nr:hypothetical protein [Gammaproteobacteria bacterium]
MSIGLDAGRTAVRLAGLATAVAIGTTTALTTTGSLIVGIVGGFVGLVAITVGIMGLANEHSRNTEKLKEIVGSENETGKDHQLKLELAKLISNANKLDQNKLGELLFVLHGIEGENITEKLCNLFDVEYNRSMDSMGGKFQVPQGLPTPQHLLGVKIIELLTGNKTEWRNVPDGIIDNITRTNIIYNEHIQKVKKELALILNRRKVDSEGKEKFEYNRAKISQFIETIIELPGDNLKEKIASLYSVDPKYSTNMDELIKKIKEKEPFLLNEIPVKFENIRHLNRVIKKMAENTYMQIVLLKSRDITPENLEMIRLTKEFKKMLLLIEGDDYDQKLDAIFNTSPFERSATKFKEIALNHPNTKAALEKKPMLMENLLKAKKEFDADYSSVFFRPFTYLQDLFYAFSGSLTGFGIVTGIAAFVGVGIATSGVGLIILIAALASAVVGFTIAYLVQRYTRSYSKSFNKETNETTDLTQKATAKAKELNNELQNRPAPQPASIPQQTVPTDSLIRRSQFQLERAQRERIEQLENELRALRSTTPTPKLEPQEVSNNSQSTASLFSSLKEPTPSDQTTAPQPGEISGNEKSDNVADSVSSEEKAGEKRPAAKDPESPPPPTPKYSRGDDGNNNK